jgi:surface protein
MPKTDASARPWSNDADIYHLNLEKTASQLEDEKYQHGFAKDVVVPNQKKINKDNNDMSKKVKMKNIFIVVPVLKKMTWTKVRRRQLFEPGREPLPNGNGMNGHQAGQGQTCGTGHTNCYVYRGDTNLGGIVDQWMRGGDNKAIVEARFGSISQWDVSQVTNMKNLICKICGYGKSFNEDISSWDVGSVTDMTKSTFFLILVSSV